MKYLQTQLQETFGNVCLALCYFAASTDMKNDNVSDVFEMFSKGIKEGSLREDGYVIDGDKWCSTCSGKKCVVKKEPLPDSRSVYSAVRYELNGNAHWVLYKNKKLIWNPLKESKCVNYGTPRFDDVRSIYFI